MHCSTFHWTMGYNPTVFSPESYIRLKITRSLSEAGPLSGREEILLLLSVLAPPEAPEFASFVPFDGPLEAPPEDDDAGAAGAASDDLCSGMLPGLGALPTELGRLSILSTLCFSEMTSAEVSS